jgi:site-specific recombinase XerD
MTDFSDRDIVAFIAQLRAAGKNGSATNATQALNRLGRLLAERHSSVEPAVTPATATADDIATFVAGLKEYRPSTRTAYLRQVRDFYRWLGSDLTALVPLPSRRQAINVGLPEDPTIAAYLNHLRAAGKDGTAESVAFVLATYRRLLHRERPGATPSSAIATDLMAYRVTISTTAASSGPRPLSLSTQARHLASVRGYHDWLRRRGLSLLDAAQYLPFPRLDQRIVRKDYLSTQEAQALLETAGARVEHAERGTKPWAKALRDLTAVALALASGRRRSGLCALRVTDLDLDRGEMRVEREKGRAGRVLPLAAWAIDIARVYIEQARPLLLRGRRGVQDCPELLIGTPGNPYTVATYRRHLRELVAETIAANPDLTELTRKSVTTHSLRVTTARLLFSNGCPIRSVNEILLHRKLSTTAAYTPIPTEELRRVLVAAHPRA